MKEYLRKYGTRIAIILSATAFLLLLSVAVRSGVGLPRNTATALNAPLQKVLGSTVNWFNSMYGYLYQYDSLMAENESLRTQLAEAQQSARDGVAASEENARLQEALKLREQHRDFVLESAKVVLWSDTGWSSSFTISKGRSSGIEQGDPVITETGALVGQVTELDENSAVVSTVIDVDMSVGAYVGASGSTGMVVGEFALMKKKTAKLTFLSDGAQIFEDDEVLTSGSGGAFPAGLLIGTLSNVQTEAGGQIEYGIVVPEVEMDTLVQVFIIKEFARGD